MGEVFFVNKCVNDGFLKHPCLLENPIPQGLELDLLKKISRVISIKL